MTTASDSHGLLAVDLLGAEDGWRLEASPEALRQAAAAVVNRLPVGLFQDAGTPIELPPGIRRLASFHQAQTQAQTQDQNQGQAQAQDQDEARGLAALLVVTDRCVPTVVPAQVVYRPPSLVVGVGCSRGASTDDVLAAIDLALRQGGLAKASLALLATIDRRAQEPGVVAAAATLEVPVRAYPAERLAKVRGLPTPSEVVRSAVGAPGVCEPAALLASGATCLLVPKVKTARATAAIARLAQASGVPHDLGPGGLCAGSPRREDRP